MTVPTWMKRPTGPGIWICAVVRGKAKQVVMFTCDLDDDDLKRGAPFNTDMVYGPVPEPEERWINDND